MTRPDALKMIELIKQTNYKLNDWEKGFIEGIENRMVTPLSYKQHCAMEALYRKATGGGNFQRRQII